MNTPKLYTVKEAAKIVGVSTNTLYKYLDEDRIHAARGSAIQGRFRIPESALEEFLGVKLSQPESTESSVGATFTVARDNKINTQVSESSTSSTQVPEKCLQTQSSLGDHLPLKLTRLLLLVALVAVLVDLFISGSISLAGSISRLLFLGVMLLLAYQEGGFRRT